MNKSILVLKALAQQWIANKVESSTVPDGLFKHELSLLSHDYDIDLSDKELADIENEVVEFIDTTRDQTFLLGILDGGCG